MYYPQIAKSFTRNACIAFFLMLGVLILPATGYAQFSKDRGEMSAKEDVRKPARLNNRNFQKNLETYASQLDLTSRQVKKLNRIERKYTRKETKLARKPSTKKKEIRAVQKEKRERMIAVLDYEQQQKLQKLSQKNNFWDIFRARN